MSIRSTQLALVAIVACLAILSGNNVHATSQGSHAARATIDSGQYQILLELADYWPLLKSRTSGAWNAANLGDACASNYPVYGLTECDANGFPTTLNFGDASSAGQLPDALAGLTKLENLVLAAGVTGSLPSSYSALTKLRQLQIAGTCALTGTIPSSYSSMTSLFAVILTWDENAPVAEWNAGVLPMNSIYTFTLNNYNFGPSNPLPAEIYSSWPANLQLTNIIYDGSAPNLVSNTRLNSVVITGNPAYLAAQQASSFPAVWSGMTSLTSFTLANLPWSGSIPSTLPANMNTLSMTTLPNWSGSIPQSLMDSTVMTDLTLSNMSQVTGVIPGASTPSTSVMKTLTLNGLSVTGTVSGSLLDIPTLTTISMTDLQSLDSPIPVGSGTCKVTNIQLSNSGFTGTIPAYYTTCSSLGYIDFSSNSLTGVFPESWATNPFFSLNVSNNELSGTIGTYFSTKTGSYSSIDLSNNNFAGAIPRFGPFRNFLINNNNFTVCATTDMAASLTASVSCNLFPQLESICGCADAGWSQSCSFSAHCATPTATPTAVPVEAPTSTPTTTPSAPVPTATPTVVPTHVPTAAASIVSISNVLLMASLAVILTLSSF